MANRYFNQFPLHLEKKVVGIFAHVTFGSSGAPTLDVPNSKGVVSVTRLSAGKFKFVFGTQAGMLDVYNKLLMIDYLPDTSAQGSPAPSGAADITLVDNKVSVPGSCYVTVDLSAAGSVADPASGDGGYFKFTFKDSTAP